MSYNLQGRRVDYQMRKMQKVSRRFVRNGQKIFFVQIFLDGATENATD